MFLAIVTRLIVEDAVSYVSAWQGCRPYNDPCPYPPCCPSRTICISSRPQPAVRRDCYIVSHSVYPTGALSENCEYKAKITLAAVPGDPQSFLKG